MIEVAQDSWSWIMKALIEPNQSETKLIKPLVYLSTISLWTVNAQRDDNIYGMDSTQYIVPVR